jgi:hypothetical protein
LKLLALVVLAWEKPAVSMKGLCRVQLYKSWVEGGLFLWQGHPISFTVTAVPGTLHGLLALWCVP